MSTVDLTPKQQASEAIRQAETIVITTGQNPNVDQTAAVLALSAILRKFGKKVTAIVSDNLPAQAEFLGSNGLDRNLSGLRDFILKVDVSKSEVDKLRYEVIDGKLNIFITPFKGGFAPSDVTFDYGNFQYDLAIVLGVPTRARIDRIYAANEGVFQAIPMVNIDFHRSNENYGAINLIEPNASSLCEILVATSESLQSGLIDADIATVMLTGLMASTDRFTAVHTTSKSLTVAAQMMAAGARQQEIVRALYRSDRASAKPQSQPQGRENPRPVVPKREDQVTQQSTPQVTPQASVAPLKTEAVREVETIEQAPIAHEPTEHPIIDPSHIELSHPEDESRGAVEGGYEVPRTSSVPPEIQMADFAGAAEILEQRRAELETDNVVE